MSIKRTLLLINYANAPFYKSQRFNSETGLRVAGFDRVISYGPQDIDADFYKKNRHILSQWRGNGYWLWKPYFIKKSLALLNDGDFLFYCDSGAHFISPIEPLINLCQQSNQDILPFEMRFVEKYWTKRDAFILMNCDTRQYTDTFQRAGTYSLWRKTPFSMNFANDLLTLAQDERMITDLKNQIGLSNYPGYRGHRHDQSIFSLLTKKYGLEAYRDPANQNPEERRYYPNSPYEPLIQITRKRSYLADVKNLPKLIIATPTLWQMVRENLSAKEIVCEEKG